MGAGHLDTDGTVLFQRVGEDDGEREAMVEAMLDRLKAIQKK